MTESVKIEGLLNLELDGFPIRLEAKENGLHLTFFSLTGLRRFQRFFSHQGIGGGNLPSHSPLSQFMDRLAIFYYLGDSPIGETGPLVKGSWWTNLVGLKNLKINASELIKAFFLQLFKKSS